MPQTIRDDSALSMFAMMLSGGSYFRSDGDCDARYIHVMSMTKRMSLRDCEKLLDIFSSCVNNMIEHSSSQS